MFEQFDLITNLLNNLQHQQSMDAPDWLPAGSTKPAFGSDYSYRDIKVVPESSTFLRDTYGDCDD